MLTFTDRAELEKFANDIRSNSIPLPYVVQKSISNMFNETIDFSLKYEPYPETKKLLDLWDKLVYIPH